MQFPITIGLHRSSFLGWGIAGTHLMALAVVLVPPWLSWVKAALLAGVAGSAIFAWRHWSPVVDGLRLFDDGRMECRLAGTDAFLEVELQPTATVHFCLTVVPLKVGGHKIVVVILPDSTQPEDFRRLRVWLRWRADFSAAKNAV